MQELCAAVILNLLDCCDRGPSIEYVRSKKGGQAKEFEKLPILSCTYCPFFELTPLIFKKGTEIALQCNGLSSKYSKWTRARS